MGTSDDHYLYLNVRELQPPPTTAAGVSGSIDLTDAWGSYYRQLFPLNPGISLSLPASQGTAVVVDGSYSKKKKKKKKRKTQATSLSYPPFVFLLLLRKIPALLALAELFF